MKSTFLIIIVFLYCGWINSCQKKPHFPDKTLSKQYAMEFALEKFISDSSGVQPFSKFSGIVFRKDDYIYSKSSIGIGIFQDSICLFIDTIDSTIMLDKSFSLSTKLLVPFYDPLEIFKHAAENNNSYRSETQREKITQDFFFSPDRTAAKHIRTVHQAGRDSFFIEFTYQSLNDEIKDVIKYKPIFDSSMIKSESIFKYIEEKEGKFFLRTEFKKFTFFNNTSLHPIFPK